MEYLTAGKAKRKWADTAPHRANPWKRKGESTQGNVRTVRKDTVQRQHERCLQKSQCQQRGRRGRRSDGWRTRRLYQRELEEYQGANQAQGIQPPASQEGRNTQARRRSEETGNTDRNGQGNSAGHRTDNKSNVWAAVFGMELWLQTEQKLWNGYQTITGVSK